jgi:hypothetical protein
MLGCQFYQASLGFSAFGWFSPAYSPFLRNANCRFLWTISMTWNISRIHKLIRKKQMRRINSDEKEFVNRADMESQASQYANRAHFTNSPLHDVNYGNFTPSL